MDDTNDRLTVFTGPVYGDLDRNIYLSDTDSARVPSGFFKVICFRLKGGVGPEKLGVYAFAIFQDAAVLRDQKGRKTVKTNRNYQVTITELQQLTGIDFGEDLYNRNPLFYTDTGPRRMNNNVHTFPERIPLNGAANMVVHQKEKRCDLTIHTQRRVIIASAMINPMGNEAAGEWVSLHNLGSEAVNLEGWKLVDNKQRKTSLAGVLEPGDSKRLSGTTLGTIKLANSGGGLMLHDTGQNDCVIDHVSWSRQDVAKLDEGVALAFGNG